MARYARARRTLAIAEVREPNAADTTAAGRFGSREVVRVGRAACCAHIVLGRSRVPAGRRNSLPAGKVRDIRVAVTKLRPPGDEIIGHPLEGESGIPHLGPLARILREVG